MKRNTLIRTVTVVWMGTCVAGAASQEPSLREILERLERVERENRELRQEMQALKSELAATARDTGKPSPVEDRLAVVETRVEEQAQAKVEAAQKLPVRITGMALFNAFHNSRNAGSHEQNPLIATESPGARTAGASVRQTVLGLEFESPKSLWGAAVRGSMFGDFFTEYSGYSAHPRLRTATLELAWRNTSLTVGQDKPLVAAREPNSLAQVGYGPLSYSGNLWLWAPQAKLEQRMQWAPGLKAKAQLSLLQTAEEYSYTSAQTPALEQHRPALQGRFEVAYEFAEDRRVAFAPMFHRSTTHIAQSSVDSYLWGFDWAVDPLPKVVWTGTFFKGQNLGGIGGLRQGVYITRSGRPVAVGSYGGWTQLTILPTSRLTLNLMAGQQDDRNSDMFYRGIAKNASYAGNLMFRIAPNVLLSFETSQVRTTYFTTGVRRNNHYDLAVAYLF